MPAWKGWMIQLLNIAGLGPIFGAVSGALYGPVAFIWIVVGCIIAGGVHDYFSGMLSLRHGGAQFPKLVQHYLGKFIRVFTDIVSVVLMVFCCCFRSWSSTTTFIKNTYFILGSINYHICVLYSCCYSSY